MKTWVYILRRLLLLIPQMFLILVATFFLIRLLPGDPARLQLGPLAPEEGVQALRQRMELDKSMPVQFYAYVKQLFHGDLGYSWVNSSSVASDLQSRLPATLELIFLGLLVTLIFLVPLGVLTATRGGGPLSRILKRFASIYGLLAGALPDFWLGLLMLYVFFTKLHVLPGPEGRLAIGAEPPNHITGFYTVDALLAGDFSTLWSALQHLILPVFTLAFVYGSVIFKYAWSGTAQALRSDFTAYADACGLRARKVQWYALRYVAPPMIVVTGVTAGYLLGGAVLIETVFNLNGVGQYAVQSIVSSDYAPIQGFVLIAAVFTMVVYLVVDLVHFAVDPRVRVQGAAKLGGR